MYNREYTPERISELKPNEIIVFGSNLEGSFNDGPARLSFERFVANRDQGVGLQGQSYAIPIIQGEAASNKAYVDEFIEFALNHPECKFIVTRLDSKISRVSPYEIAPLFLKVIDLPNVILPKMYVQVILRFPEVATGAFHAWDPKRDFLDEYHSLTEKMIRGEHDAFDKLRRLRRSVVRHTIAVVNHGWYMTGNKKRYVFPDDSDMVHNTVRYEQSTVVPDVSQMPRNAAPTIIEVENMDCLHAGARLKEQGYNPAVLNMDQEHFSSNADDGANQEASLRTNLFRSLSPFGRFESRYLVKEMLYTPNAIYFRESEQNGFDLLDYPITLSFISAAGEINPKGFGDNQTIPDDLVEPFRNKIRSIFRIGLVHGHDSLVLGALGCGAFHNPPRHVARLFHEVMDEPEFKNKYRKIVFAILDDHHVHQSHNPEGNYKPFVNEFTRFDVESDIQKWIEVNEIHSRTLEGYQELLSIHRDHAPLQYKLHGLTPQIYKASCDIEPLSEELRDERNNYGGYFVRINQYLALLDKMGQVRGYYVVSFNHLGRESDDWFSSYMQKAEGQNDDFKDEHENKRNFFGLLESVTFPHSVARIGKGTKSIDIPFNTIIIRECAFNGCKGLTSIFIPESVRVIGKNAFVYCNLGSITVAPKNKVFDSRNDCNAIIESATNKLVAGCKNTVIPDTVTKIGFGAFKGLDKLTSIVIPDSVTEIEGEAFMDCINLNDVILPNRLKYLGSSAFEGCTRLKTINIPDGVVEIGKKAFFGCKALNNIIIPASVDEVGSDAFAFCDSLTSIDFSKTINEGNVKAVDLGLPSGTKWADCNVGANTPEEYGGYFAWGETKEKEVYDWDTYDLCNCRDIGNISGTLVDVAYLNWGRKWRVPTHEQIAELVTYCSYDWVTLNGIAGGKFTGPNGNSIFLPAAGGRFKSEVYHDGENGFYWSDNNHNIFFDCKHACIDHSFARYGFTVRPVATQ